MEEDNGKIFSVFFSDGKREVHMGSIKIRPSTDFKKFQESLSDRIGISLNQITVYLVDQRQYILITSKSNFAAIAEQNDCSFLVVLKRSRRSNSTSRRSPKPKQGGLRLGDGMAPVQGNYRLLRRNQPDLNNPNVCDQPDGNNPYVFDPPNLYNPYVYDHIPAFEFGNFSQRFKNLEIQRQNYARMMRNLDLNAFRVAEDVFRASSTGADKYLFCEECDNAGAEGRNAPFHCCVFDPMVAGFRSTAGPVARPGKAVQ